MIVKATEVWCGHLQIFKRMNKKILQIIKKAIQWGLVWAIVIFSCVWLGAPDFFVGYVTGLLHVLFVVKVTVDIKNDYA